jgi:hypothetical protein
MKNITNDNYKVNGFTNFDGFHRARSPEMENEPAPEAVSKIRKQKVVAELQTVEGPDGMSSQELVNVKPKRGLKDDDARWVRFTRIAGFIATPVIGVAGLGLIVVDQFVKSSPALLNVGISMVSAALGAITGPLKEKIVDGKKTELVTEETVAPGTVDYA